MKRLYMIIVTSILLCNYALGQKTIKMEKEGGIYKISCKVNGAPMKMYFDTGASTVSISKATALYLLENDLIGPQDYRGKTKSTTADGAISDKMVINLRDIEIAGLHLRDVLATVSYSLNAPLLLGQTAIQRLGKISLQGNILTIHTNASGQNQNKQDRAELDKKLRNLRDTRYSNDDSSYEILEIIEKIETNYQLNEFELFCKTMSLANVLKYDDAISAAQIWIDRYASNTDSIDWKMRVYFIAAEANMISENGNKEKGMEYLRRCENYWNKISDETSDFYWYYLPILEFEYSKYKNGNYDSAISAAKASLKHFLDEEHVSIDVVNRNMCPVNAVTMALRSLAIFYGEEVHRLSNNNMIRSSDHLNRLLANRNNYTIMAAKAGDPESIKICKEMLNVDYKRILSREEIDYLDFY